VTCAICDARKEKRFCLALDDRICPQCCGEQREVTVDCLSECPYLQQAREHEKRRHFDGPPPDDFFPKVELREDFLQRNEMFIGGLLQTLLGLAENDRALKDADISGALSTMIRSYQTLVGSGLVYQQPSPNPVQASIIDGLQKSIDEFRRIEHQHLGYTGLKDSDVLRALVFMVRLGIMHTSGRPLSRAFIDYMRAQFPNSPAAAEAQQSSRIILP
jgi:hypothetical protein